LAPLDPDWLVVPHLLDVADERLDGPEELPELGAAAEPLQMALRRVPFDPQHVAARLLGAAGQLERQAVRGGEERDPGQGVGPLELATARGGEPITDVFHDHSPIPPAVNPQLPGSVPSPQRQQGWSAGPCWRCGLGPYLRCYAGWACRRYRQKPRRSRARSSR